MNRAMDSEERHYPPLKEIMPLCQLIFQNALQKDVYKGGIAYFATPVFLGNFLKNYYLQT